jgi:hypothetical protein
MGVCLAKACAVIYQWLRTAEFATAWVAESDSVGDNDLALAFSTVRVFKDSHTPIAEVP